MLERSSTRYLALLYITDILITLASLRLAEELRPILPLGKDLTEPGGRLSPSIYIVVIVIWSLVLLLSSAYDPRRLVRATEEAGAIIVAVAQGTLIMCGFLYLTYRGLSRLLFGYFFILDFCLLLASRMFIRVGFKLSRAQRVSQSRVLIIGANSVARSVGHQVARLGWMGLELVGYVAEDEAVTEATDATPVANGNRSSANGDERRPDAPVLGGLADAPTLVQSLGVSEVIVALPLTAHDELANMVALLQELPVNIKIVPDFFDMVFFRATIEDLGGMPMIGVKEPVISGFHRVAKRILDVTIAGIGLLVLSPVMLVVAILIRLDSPGPVVFRQARVGENGRLFWMYKLRTMVAGAEEQQSTLISQDNQGNIVFRKTPNDPRLTRLGRFLRRYSLDEVPQCINVLRGEMSLVGPRPELPAIVQTYQPWQRKRFAVPPGMTGWWQIRGRSQQPMHLRTEDDLYYIQNYSLLLDLHILWKTIGAVLSGRGAY